MTTNNTTLVFLNQNEAIGGVHSIRNLKLNTDQNGNFDVLDSVTVTGDFVYGGSFRTDIEGPGVLITEGDIFLRNLSNNHQGNGTVMMAGSSNQSVISEVAIGDSELPNFVINKSGGTATFDGNVSIYRDFTYVQGNTDFDSQNSKLCFTNNNVALTGSVEIHKLHVDFDGNGDLDVLDTITVVDSAIFTGIRRIDVDGPGELHLQGDVLLDMERTDNQGNGTLRFNGTANQNVVSTAPIETGEVPSVVIDKTGGTLRFSGIISVEDNWTYLQGNTDYATDSATIAFTAVNQIISGVNDFWNLTFEHNGNGDIDINDTLNVFGDFLFSGGPRQTDMLGGGVINLYRDFTINNSNAGNDGDVLIRITGNNDQQITSSAAIEQGEIPDVEIAKTGGTASFDGVISVWGDWTYTSGNTDYAADSATIAVTFRNHVITGNNDFSNMTLEFNNNGDFDVNDTINVQNEFTLSSNRGTDIDGPGIINVSGDVSISNTSAGNDGNGLIRLVGSNDQSIVSTSNIERGELPDVEIAKTGGTASFDGIVSVWGDWTYTSGNTDYATDSATIAFTNSNHILSGANQFFNMTLEFNGGGDFDVNDTTEIYGTFSLSSNQGTDIDGPGVLDVYGDISISNTSGGNDGNGLVRLVGNNDQSIISTSNAEAGELPSVNINKTGGTASFDGIISVFGDWTYDAGTVDMTTDSEILILKGGGFVLDGEAASNMSFWAIELRDGNRRSLTGDVFVENLLDLNGGEIDLNGNTLTINNPSPDALLRNGTGAYIISEDTDFSSVLSWNISTTQDTFVFPLNTGGRDIPFTLILTAGDIGTFSVSTYSTAADNTPFPVTPDSVRHLTNLNTGLDNSANVVDRFWYLDKDGPSGTVSMTFEYWQGERPQNGELNLRAQRYDAATNNWQDTISGQSNDPNANTVTVPGVDTFSVWTLALGANPLPIELVSFEVSKLDSKSMINWSTASEGGTDYFVIERSADKVNFSEIGRVEAQGYSYQEKDYVFVDGDPILGQNYYRLKSVDFDGSLDYSEIRVLEFDARSMNRSYSKVYPNPSNSSELKVIPAFDGANLEIRNSYSAILYSEADLKRDELFALSDLNLAAGAYFLSLSSTSEDEVFRIVIK